MTFKQLIHQRYQQLLQDRIDVFRDRIHALAQEARNDAKSSAGDKHETALSMMQLEQEKLNVKLAEIYDQKAVLDRIDPSVAHSHIALGSLVQTNHFLLYVCAALPKVSVDGVTVIAVSPQSPLGEHLMGKQGGYSFVIHTAHYQIDQVS